MAKIEFKVSTVGFGLPDGIEQYNARRNVKKTKVRAGHYIYRNHHIYHETDYCGPEGGARLHWSISGEIGTPDEGFSHPDLPQLDTLKGAMLWLDAAARGESTRQIERDYAPKTWGA